MNLTCFVLLLAGCLASARAQEPLAPAPAPDPAFPSVAAADPLDPALARAASLLPAGGMVVAEVRSDGVHYLSVGRAAPVEGIPPERVIFEVGSIAKVFTGLLLAQAVVEHRVALGDPIGRYLPANLALAPAVAAITLEQLATHTAGLPREPPNLAPRDPYDPFAGYSVADLDAFLQTARLPAPLPQPASYSNLGAGLLGHILELAWHESYSRLVAEKIAQPLQLVDTGTELSDEQQGRLATPHRGTAAVRPLRYGDGLVAAGGLYSTAADLVRLTHVLGLAFDHPLREAWALARQPRADFPAMNGKIGLGVLIMERGGRTIYWHGGTAAGSRAHLEWSPADGHVLVVLMNSDSIEAMNSVVTLYQLVPDRPSGNVGR
jgi:CubicO group peptidase (beta-lactamase class C family)